MAKSYPLVAQTRDRAGKGIARALRREEKVPAVIYGDNKEPVLISLDSRDVEMEYHKAHMFTMLCDIEIDGKKTSVLARDIQTHPVTDRVVHVDFLRVTKKTKIAVQVPVNFINEDQCKGLEEKGILNVVRHELELMCSATHIPEHIDVDLSPFEIGDTIKMSNATLTDGATSVEERDVTIATIAAPRVMDEESDEDEDGEEGAEEASEESSDAEGDAE